MNNFRCGPWIMNAGKFVPHFLKTTNECLNSNWFLYFDFLVVCDQIDLS